MCLSPSACCRRRWAICRPARCGRSRCSARRASACCRTCRPPTNPACPASNPSCTTACWLPRAHRGRSSTGSTPRCARWWRPKRSGSASWPRAATRSPRRPRSMPRTSTAKRPSGARWCASSISRWSSATAPGHRATPDPLHRFANWSCRMAVAGPAAATENVMPTSRLPHACLAALAMVLLTPAMPARSQVSLLPPDVQRVLADVGPQWGKALAKNIETTIATFQPILKAAPKDGVVVSKNIAYGEDPKQILDVHQPQGAREAPVVIFIHGGAYVRGDKDLYGEMYGNIATWFARQGALGINATYRLAPGTKWPSAADDVRAMVKWAKENAARFGGDPNRVYLVGHSAGATHVASYTAARHRPRRERRGPDQRPLSPRIRPGRSQRQEHAGLFRRGQQRLCGAIADHAYPRRRARSGVRGRHRIRQSGPRRRRGRVARGLVRARWRLSALHPAGEAQSPVRGRRLQPAKFWNSCGAGADPVRPAAAHAFFSSAAARASTSTSLASASGSSASRCAATSRRLSIAARRSGETRGPRRSSSSPPKRRRMRDARSPIAARRSSTASTKSRFSSRWARPSAVMV